MENIVRNGEIAFNMQFLLLSQCFLPYLALTFHFKCTLKKLSSVCLNLDQSKICLSGNALTLSNDKVLDSTKFKAFADKKINVAKMRISISDRLENIVGKGENVGICYFLLFQ